MAEQIVLLNETSATHIAPIQNGGGGGGRGGNSPAPRATSTAFLRRKAGLVMGWFDWQHKGVGGEGGGGNESRQGVAYQPGQGEFQSPSLFAFKKQLNHGLHVDLFKSSIRVTPLTPLANTNNYFDVDGGR